MIDQWSIFFKSKIWKEDAIDLWYVQLCKVGMKFLTKKIVIVLLSVKINVKYNFFF